MRCAADTNFFISLAASSESALDALEVLRREARRFDRLATETVMVELRHLSRQTEDLLLADWARQALGGLESRWQFRPTVSTSAESLLVESLSQSLLASGIVPPEERHDGRILAESAVQGCVLLVSDDSHLRSVDRARLEILLKPFDLEAPLVVTTRELVRMFYR